MKLSGFQEGAEEHTSRQANIMKCPHLYWGRPLSDLRPYVKVMEEETMQGYNTL